MKISKAYNVMSALATAGLPVMLRGTMGLGKSAIVKKFAAKTGKTLVDLRLAQMDVISLMGVFVLDGDNSRFARPDTLPTMRNSILFLDEITSASPEVQALAYQLILEKQVGPHKLPDDCIVLAAGNLETDNGIVNDMAAPLMNRLTHIDIDLDKDDWINWAMSDGEICDEIIGFIAYMGEQKLHSFNPESKDFAFATPRTWEYANAAYKSVKGNRDMEASVVKACVGGSIGTEFMAFVEVQSEMPNLDDVLAGRNVPAPSKLDVKWAVGVALSGRVDDSNIGNAIKYLESMGDYSKEISVFAIRMAMRRLPKFATSREFVDLCNRYGEALKVTQ